MDSEHCELYCEGIALHHKKIKAKVEKIRYQQAVEITRTYEYKDGVANAVADKNTDIEKIEIYIDGVKATINYPEYWLKTFKLALKRFKERYGEEASTTIQNRYGKGMIVTETYVKQGISKSLFDRRRLNFLKIFVYYALKFRLLDID